MHDSPLHQRTSGILLHPTSLPGPYAVGDVGPAARRFVDYLARAGQHWWQMLPIGPLGGGDSPYDSPSAFAGSPMLISLDGLVEDGLLDRGDLDSLPPPPAPHRADYGAAVANREPLLRRAYDRFASGQTPHLGGPYDAFVSEHASWVWDYALFSALKQAAGFRPWFEWDEPLRRRDPGALERAHGQHRTEILYRVFLQFAFHHQWQRLRRHAENHGVKLLGDVPMFVSHDSADVWSNQHMFFLDSSGRQTVLAGVPPDYFSEDGQLWGNPLYRWDVMQRDGYGWWIDRLRRTLGRFDAVRLDHFIAFCRYWEIPVGATTAKSGRYVPVPGHHFFEVAREKLGSVPFIAEDLGIVTEEVHALRDRFEMPGMRVLQFGFTPGAEAYLPHRFSPNSVVYTGTHDNDTVMGWYGSLRKRAQMDHHVERGSANLSESDRRSVAAASAARVELERANAYAGIDDRDAEWHFIRTALSSVANTAIFPIQDLLGLGADARMNVPGTPMGNWVFRLLPDQLDENRAARLRDLCELTERV
jgi:4-alpha-glucanotransferase